MSHAKPIAVRLLWALSALVAVSACDCGGDRPQLQQTEAALLVATRELDFGPVQEFTNKARGLEVQNAGNAPVTLSAAIENAASSEFTLVYAPAELAGSSTDQIEVNFAPVGGGSDEGVLVITSDDPASPQIRIALRGGPIAPVALLSPDPLSFVPSFQALETKQAKVLNVGTSTLTVHAVGVALGGNPDFSVSPPVLPAKVKVGEVLFLDVSYARSARKDEGRLEVHSDDPDAGVQFVKLLPDPAKACTNGVDDDADGLSDFPDDPGCSAPSDDDEYNPPECLAGATQPCGMSTGACKQGMRSCMNGLWSQCTGAVNPTSETCDGLDNDCNGKVDEGVTEACVINGCAGARACKENAGGTWDACFPVGGAPEQCDGTDNDCDGQVDEGVTQACLVNGCSGSQLCVPGGMGTWTMCQPTSVSAETCNGGDDDCDGQTDEGLGTLTCGFGACMKTEPACVNGMAGMCTPGMSTAETCNGVDDDCDQQVDEGLGTLTCGVGACVQTVPACMNGMAGMCTGGTGSAEQCNNIDDDCDGSVDESLSRGCYSGPPGTQNVGKCVGGMQACTTGAWGVCSGEVLPGTEVCGNSIDDNCNGSIDEGCGTVCLFPPSTGADAQEANNTMASAKPVVSPAAFSVTTYTYNLTLPSMDNDWIKINIPTSGSTTQARAEILCVNYGAGGCGSTAPAVGLYLWYSDPFSGTVQDGADNGKNGLAVVQNSGPISSFFQPQAWYVQAYPSSVVCSGEAVNATLKITVTNN